MIRVMLFENREGCTFALPHEERKRWPRCCPRVFVAKPGPDVPLSAVQLRAAVSILIDAAEGYRGPIDFIEAASYRVTAHLDPI